MANGDNNNNLDQQINANIDQELARIDQMIADMHAAEQKASEQGLMPGQYNLSAMTQQERQKRIEAEQANRGGGDFQVDYTKTKEQNVQDYAQWLANTMTGTYSAEEMLPEAKMKIEKLFDPNYRKLTEESLIQADILSGRNRKFPSYVDPRTDQRKFVLDTFGNEGIFDIGGDEYKMLEYTDKAANQVLLDENGKIKEDSPVVVLGMDNNNKPILAAKKDYNAAGINPKKLTFAKETLDPEANVRDIEYKLASTLEFKDDPEKMRNIIYNRINPVYGSIGEAIDQDAVDMVKKLQDTGLLREKPKAAMEPIPVEWESEEQKQKWMENYQKKQEAIRSKTNL